MSDKRRFWIFIGGYLLIVAGGFSLLAWGNLGVSWNIVVAIGLLILTASVSYSLAHPKKKK